MRRPLLICPAQVGAAETVFVLPDRRVRVTLPAAVAREVVARCDGATDEDEVIAALARRFGAGAAGARGAGRRAAGARGTKGRAAGARGAAARAKGAQAARAARADRAAAQAARQLLAALLAHGVLVESRDASPLAFSLWANPPPFPQALDEAAVARLVADDSLQRARRARRPMHVEATEWTRLLGGRRSVRDYAGTALPAAALARVLWSAYGALAEQVPGTAVPRRTVPSAGALYPLVLHLGLLLDGDDRAVGGAAVASGVYRVGLREPGRVDLVGCVRDRPAIALRHLLAAFSDAVIPTGTAAVLVLSGVVARSAAKYGNRGLLFTVLEAGHAAQAALLAAQADGLGALEVGAFSEDPLRAALALPAGYQPLTAICLGVPPAPRAPGPAAASPVAEGGSPPGQPTRRTLLVPAGTEAGGYALPFSLAFARLPEGGWTSGRDRDPALARTKALAEAVERDALRRPLPTRLASLAELGPAAIDPRDIVRYLPGQLRRGAPHGVRAFDPRHRYEWCAVRDALDDAPRLVLAEFLQVPYAPADGRRYAALTSSGTAAHRHRDEAMRRALLELIERDAFHLTWLNRLRRTALRPSSLPRAVVSRLRALGALGLTVTVLDLTLDLAPVLLVAAGRRAPPFFTCAAAAGADLPAALDHALMEVEASVYCYLRDGAPEAPADPAQVRDGADHAALYRDRRHLRQADFLLRPDATVGLAALERTYRDRPAALPDLLQAVQRSGLRTYVADLGGSDPPITVAALHVVRLIVPGLVPLTFGEGLAPLGLGRMRDLPVILRLVPGARRFARLNRFPHPYD